MKLIRNTITLLTASLGTVILAGPAAALPVSTASLAYNGTINFNASSGLSVVGDLNAQYRTPPDGPARPYQFQTSLDFGALTLTPELTVTTPEIVLIAGTETCLPVIGCFTTPDITLPSQSTSLTPSITLTDLITVYDYSYTSDELPLGDIFNVDFGTPLLGDALTIDDLVQAQFETGATTVSETGLVIGPLISSYDYTGVLQPDGSTILGSYQLDLFGPGLLAELEAAILKIINDNTAVLSEIALQGLLASNPCGNLSIGQSVCNDLINGLDSADLLVTVDSIGTLSSDFSLLKSITPVPAPVPAPATLPLLGLSLVLMGLVSGRRRKIRAA